MRRRPGVWITAVLACLACPPGNPVDRRAGADAVSERAADDERFASAVVVVEAEHLGVTGGSKYHWSTIRPLRVLKNDSDQRFEGPLSVAHYSWEPGPPAGISIYYLVPYGAAEADRWRMLGASAPGD